MNTPEPLDNVAVVGTLGQQYRVHLLTDPAGTGFWLTGTGAAEPSDPSYHPIDTTGLPDPASYADWAQATLDTVTWDCTGWVVPTTVTGWAINAVFDDGETLMDADLFGQPFLVGPGGMQEISIPSALTAFAAPADMPIRLS